MNKTPKSQFLSCIATALAVALVPAPALAQTAGVSKAEAILGGSSQLAAILAGQQGQAVPQVPTAPLPLGLASLSTPAATYPVLRQTRGYGTAAATGRPDVFGSVALKVGRTPLDKRWHQVSGKRVSGALVAQNAFAPGDDLRVADHVRASRASDGAHAGDGKRATAIPFVDANHHALVAQEFGRKERGSW